MTEPLLILLTTLFAVAVFLGLGMMAWYFILRQLRKETGPWVVTRVGVGGGVEFYRGEWDSEWTNKPAWACVYGSEFAAEGIAMQFFADVHPLFRYVGGVR